MEEILNELLEGRISVREAERRLKVFAFKEIENSAKLDIGRESRKGIPEVVLAEGKSIEDLVKIVSDFVKISGRAIVTRVDKEIEDSLKNSFKEFEVHVNSRARIVIVKQRGFKIKKLGRKVGIICAGTADIQVAEEARVITEEMGCETVTAYDVGIAGIHRLFPCLRKMIEEDVDTIIVVAGMEGSLPSVVAGLVDVPVIGVPSSRGYGFGGKGRAALMSMLQSCSPGLAVMNIDNGFGAGIFASIICRRIAKLLDEHRKIFISFRESDHEMETAFCVKCRKKVTMVEPTTVTLKTGRKALKGKCPTCGKFVYRFVKATA